MTVLVLPGELKEDRTVGWSTVLSSQSNLVKPNVGLEIEPQDGGLILRIYPNDLLKAKFPEREVPLKLTEALLSEAVNNCQTTWWKNVVDRKSLDLTYPFHALAENPVSEGVFRKKVLPALAEAGRELFVQVFRPSGDGFEATRNVGTVLRELMKEPDMWIAIRSRRFFVPWNFMYLGNLSEPDLSSFWGYQHLIEHDVAKRSSNHATLAGNVRVAAHFDVEIDERFKKFRCIQHFRDLLGEYGLEAQERNTRSEFRSALEKGAGEHIFYFCCHARAGKHEGLSLEGQRLFLTDPRPQRKKENDREYIAPNQIDTWLDECQDLQGNPLVFINACEAAKTGSIFYEGFASKFLDHSASAVIGPELEMPIVFAREFAHNFFKDFFKGGTENTVGKILLRWRRKYLTEFRNPLGLAYSLYRGGGMGLEGPLSVAPQRSIHAIAED